jgi:hypothetical protein
MNFAGESPSLSTLLAKRRDCIYCFLWIASLDIREGTLGQNSLCDHAREGKHSKTAVSDFLELHVSNLSLRLSLQEANGVKAEVTGFASRSLEHLNDGNRADDLSKAEPEEQLPHGTVLDKGVVGGDRGESLIGLGKRVDAETKVDGGKTDDGQLAHASVLQLSLAEEVNRDEIREAEGVETDISDVSTEIGGLLQERESLTGNIRDRSGFRGVLTD